IRCQRCQALYSLQDGVAASGASFRVECGRCLLVFEASAARREITTPVQTPRVPVRTPLPPAALERAMPPEDLARALKPRRPEPFAEDEFERELRRVAVSRRRILIGLGIAAGVAIAAVAISQIRFSGLPKEAKARMA